MLMKYTSLFGGAQGSIAGIRVEAMKFHALAEPIRVETMGRPDSRQSPISRGLPEIVDMFLRTNGLEANEAIFDIFR